MTVPSTARVAGPYTGTGADATLPFAFKVFAATDLLVSRDGTALAYGSDYTVAINADQDASPGGSIAIVAAAYTTASQVWIESDVAAEQQTSITNLGGFYPKVIEQALDRITIVAQQLLNSASRLGLKASTPRANLYPVFDASGNITLSEGTGSDPALRGDLAQTTGPALIGYSGRTVKARLDDTINAMDKGASGVGTIVDTVAVQAAITAAANYGGDLGKSAYLPAGLYPLGATLTPQSYSRFHGEGPHQSVLRNDVVPIPTIPAFTAAGALTFASFDNVGARGQKSFIDVTGTTDHNLFRNIFATGMAEAGFHFRSFLQTSVFDRCVVENSPYGILADNAVVNRNTFRECEFKNCSTGAVKLAGAEDVQFLGARFEASTTYAGKYAIDVDSAHSLTFAGGYMESGHQYALRATNGAGTITFRDFHFTYYTAGVPYLWTVDAGTQLVFENCHSAVAMEVPVGSILVGNNVNVYCLNPTVASASVVTIPPRANLANITGTTTIDALTGGTAYLGQRVTMLFASALTLRDTSTGGNVSLRGGTNFVARAGDTITLAYYASGWVEVARRTISAAPVLLAQSGASAAHTGDTLEATLATITLPAGAMGANGRVEITTLWSVTNNANNKTLKAKFGGTAYQAQVVTAAATVQQLTIVQNANATGSQVGMNSATLPYASSSGATTTSAVDTTAAVTILLTGQCANAADTITLLGYQVLLWPKD